MNNINLIVRMESGNYEKGMQNTLLPRFVTKFGWKFVYDVCIASQGGEPSLLI